MDDIDKSLDAIAEKYGSPETIVDPHKQRAVEIAPVPQAVPTVGESIKGERQSEQDRIAKSLSDLGVPTKAGEVKLPAGTEFAATERGVFTSPAAKEAAINAALGGGLGFLMGGPPGALGGAIQGWVPTFLGESARGEVPAEYRKYSDPLITGAEMFAPGGFAKMSRAIEQPVLHGARGDIARYARAFEQQGGKLYPGQLTLPKGALFSERNARVINQLVTRAAGNESGVLNESWFGTTRNNLRDVYENQIYSPNNYFSYTPGQEHQIQTALAAPMSASNEALPIIDRFRQRLTSSFPGLFEPQLVPHSNGGFVQNPRFYGNYSGKEWQDAQKVFKEAEKSSNFDVRNWAKNLDATIKNTSRALDPNVNALLDRTNSQWRSLRILEDLKESDKIKRGFVDVESLGKKLNADDPTFKGRPPNTDLELAGKVGENLNVTTLPLTAEQLNQQRKGGEKIGGLVGGGMGLGTGYMMAGPMGTAAAIPGYQVGKTIGGAVAPTFNQMSRDVLGPVGRTMQRGDFTSRVMEPGARAAPIAIGTERARKVLEEESTSDQ